MTNWRQSLFALVLATRQYPNFELWTEVEQRQGANEFKHVLQQCWEYHFDKFNHIDLTEAFELIAPYIPESEQDDGDLSNEGARFAFDAAIMLNAALDAIILNTNNEAGIASKASMASVIRLCEHHYADEDLDEDQLIEKPEILAEIDFQVGLMELVQKPRTPELIKEVLEYALKEGTSNIGLEQKLTVDDLYQPDAWGKTDGGTGGHGQSDKKNNQPKHTKAAAPVDAHGAELMDTPDQNAQDLDAQDQDVSELDDPALDDPEQNDSVQDDPDQNDPELDHPEQDDPDLDLSGEPDLANFVSSSDNYDKEAELERVMTDPFDLEFGHDLDGKIAPPSPKASADGDSGKEQGKPAKHGKESAKGKGHGPWNKDKPRRNNHGAPHKHGERSSGDRKSGDRPFSKEGKDGKFSKDGKRSFGGGRSRDRNERDRSERPAGGRGDRPQGANGKFGKDKNSRFGDAKGPRSFERKHDRHGKPSGPRGERRSAAAEPKRQPRVWNSSAQNKDA